MNILILGGGKIGSLVGCLLADHQDFSVIMASQNFNYQLHASIQYIQMNISHAQSLTNLIKQKKIDAVISCLPYFLNLEVAKTCANLITHYFDLTEDVEVTKGIIHLAKNSSAIFVPQCGIAPGFINIIGEFLISKFDDCQDLRLRVGGLPQYTQNALKYALTWSLDGIINQYINPCPVIRNGQMISEPALEQCESITLEGIEYEAFNTSGGIGHLVKKRQHQIKELNYKTLRYPGHCEKIKFLLHDLLLKEDRETLKTLLKKALPEIEQDQVILFASANGLKGQIWQEHHYYKKILPQMIDNQLWSAMQVATASSVCVVVDIILQNQTKYKGLVLHEKISYGDFMANRFASYFH